RERPEDIPVLVKHFIDKYATENAKKVEDASAETMALLQAYPWPGNIRELENAMEHSLVMAEDDASLLTTDLLPQNIREAAALARAQRAGQPDANNQDTAAQEGGPPAPLTPAAVASPAGGE